MVPNDLSIILLGETLWLTPERAVFWPRRRTVVVADLHLGKASAFRAAAIPVPSGTTVQTLARLSAVVDRTGPDRLVILGDLIHARSGRSERTLEAVTAWRNRHAQLHLLLVRGNHDQSAGDPPAEWRCACVDEPLFDAPFVYRHLPQPTSSGYVFAGHIHPAVRLTGRGRQSLSLPCFHISPTVATLPAFGDFTGGAIIRPQSCDRVFAITEDTVVRVDGHKSV